MPTFLTEPQWYDKNGKPITPKDVVTNESKESTRAVQFFGPQTDDFDYLLIAYSHTTQGADYKIGKICPIHQETAETGDPGIVVDLGDDQFRFRKVYANSFIGTATFAEKANKAGNADKAETTEQIQITNGTTEKTYKINFSNGNTLVFSEGGG